MRKHTHIITLHIHAQINGQAENDAFGRSWNGQWRNKNKNCTTNFILNLRISSLL